MKRLYFLSIIFIFIFSACITTDVKKEDFVTTTYKLLSATAIIYDTAMKVAGELWAADMLSGDQRKKVDEIALKAWAAYQATVELLIAYRADPSYEAKDRVNLSLGDMSRAVGALRGYLEPISEKGGTI